MTKSFCDKCGKKVESHSFTLPIDTKRHKGGSYWRVEVKCYRRDYQYINDFSADLCQKCVAEVVKRGEL